MQVDINSSPGVAGVVGIETLERIKRRGRIRIQQRVPQSRLADLADRDILPLVPGITETSLPVPSLEIIAKLSHLTLEPNVEQSIPVGKLFTSGTGVIDAAIPNPRSHGNWDSVNDQSIIRD